MREERLFSLSSRPLQRSLWYLHSPLGVDRGSQGSIVGRPILTFLEDQDDDKGLPAGGNM